MEPFNYQRVGTPDAAVATLAQSPGGAFLAGGTTLVDLMKLGVETPRTLIDINRLPLEKIEVGDTGAKIGAMARNTELAYHPDIQKRYPALSEAILSGASPQLRNMATVGGNLMQRTRCPYFRDLVSPCNKRQADSGCSAIDGFNRSAAVLGTSPKCIATHPSDMCVALAAFEAVIVVQGVKGTRRIPIQDFYIAYGDDPGRENVLERGELITAVELPAAPYFAKSAYLKVRDRASYEFALASAAVALDVSGGTIKAARVGLGGVATKPWRSVEAEKVLVGAKAEPAVFAAAADAALRNAKSYSENGFKIELIKRTLVRTLETVAALA